MAKLALTICADGLQGLNCAEQCLTRFNLFICRQRSNQPANFLTQILGRARCSIGFEFLRIRVEDRREISNRQSRFRTCPLPDICFAMNCCPFNSHPCEGA